MRSSQSIIFLAGLLLPACSLDQVIDSKVTELNTRLSAIEIAAQESINALAESVGKFSSAIAKLEKEIKTDFKDLLQTDVRNLIDFTTAGAATDVLFAVDVFKTTLRGALEQFVQKIQEARSQAKQLKDSNSSAFKDLMQKLTEIRIDIPPMVGKIVPHNIAVNFQDGKPVEWRQPSNRILQVFGYGFAPPTIDSPYRVVIRDNQKTERELKDALISNTTPYTFAITLPADALSPADIQLILQLANGNTSRRHELPIAVTLTPAPQPVIESKTVIPGAFSLIPPKIDGIPQAISDQARRYLRFSSGQDDFDGHGPHVIVTVTIDHNAKEVWATLSIEAMEWEDGKAKSNFTKVAGQQRNTIYTAVPGETILKVTSSLESKWEFVDTNHADNTKENLVGEAVKSWAVVGDTKGDDVGKTKVTAVLNPVTIEVSKAP